MDFETALIETITKKQAQAEIKIHNHQWMDFVADCGDKESYIGSEVLYWLGY